MDLNFDGVESVNNGGGTERKESTFKIVKPGLNTLMISAVEPRIASTGSNGVVVTFESKEAETNFNHTFWTSPGAMPRLKYLVEKFTGIEMIGNVTIEALAAKLIGKSKTVVVDGEERINEKDGKVYKNVYPTLRFAGFVDPEGTAAEPIIKPGTVAPKAELPVVANNVTEDDDDLPF